MIDFFITYHNKNFRINNLIVILDIFYSHLESFSNTSTSIRFPKYSLTHYTTMSQNCQKHSHKV